MPTRGDGGHIDISVGTEDGQFVIQVTDNGSGLPVSQRQRLLEPYMTTREKGTGLGLAIVGKVLEEHGGRIELFYRSVCACARRAFWSAHPLSLLSTPKVFASLYLQLCQHLSDPGFAEVLRAARMKALVLLRIA